MITIKIDNQIYLNYSHCEIEESFDYPFRLQISLAPTAEKPLDNNFLYKSVIIDYNPDQEELDNFTWMTPLTHYYGYVFREERQYDALNVLELVTLEIFHPLHLLEKSCRFRIFSEKKLIEIIEAIFTPYLPLWEQYKITSYEFSEDIANFTIPHCTQYRENDLEFFLRLCETYGVRLVLIDQTVKLYGALGPLTGSSLAVPAIAKIESKKTSHSSTCTLKHRNILCTEKLEVLSTGEVNVVGTTTTSIENPPYPHWLDIYEPDPVIAQDKLLIHGLGLQYWESITEIRNKERNDNEPLAGIRAGQLLILSDGSELYVQKVKCTLCGPVAPGSQGSAPASQDYLIEIWAREKRFSYIMPPRHEKPKIFSFLRALVIEPKMPSCGDDKKLGRVKVQFLWEEQESPTCWVRLAMPYAGKTHGFYIMPEIGDEVLVGFEGGDIDRPFCLGSVYNKDSQVLQAFSKAKQMENVHLRTPENTFLKFHEVPATKQTAELGVQDQVTLTFDSNGPTGKLNSQGTMSISSKNLFSQSSQEKIDLDCNQSKSKAYLDKDGNIMLLGKSGELKAMLKDDGSIELVCNKGKSKLQLDSDGNASLIGNDGTICLQLSQDGTVTLQSSSDMTINATSGTMSINADSDTTTINADGDVNVSSGSGNIVVSGGEIQLNC